MGGWARKRDLKRRVSKLLSVRLLNPLSAEDGYLRRRLLPGLVRLVERNWANHVEDVLADIDSRTALCQHVHLRLPRPPDAV